MPVDVALFGASVVAHKPGQPDLVNIEHRFCEVGRLVNEFRRATERGGEGAL